MEVKAVALKRCHAY